MKQRTKNGSLSFEDGGEGPALVLLHAFPLSQSSWKQQRESLSSIARVITPDLPGFGDSRLMEGQPTIDAMGDAIARLLDELGIEQAILGGLSMGGYIALSFARRHGHRLSGLILADTKAEADDAIGKANRDKMIDFVAANPISVLVEQMLPKLLSEWTRKERASVVDEVRRIGSRQPREGLIAGLQAMRDRVDATPTLAALRVPTLVIVGSEDQPTPLEGVKRMASVIPGASLVVIEDAGHLSNLEQPERFNQAVREFLAVLS